MKRIFVGISVILLIASCTKQAKVSFTNRKYVDTIISTTSTIDDTGKTMYVSRKNRGLWQLNPAFEKYGFARDTSYIYDGDTITIAEVIIKEKL